jgi:hypothetical protein
MHRRKAETKSQNGLLLHHKTGSELSWIVDANSVIHGNLNELKNDDCLMIDKTSPKTFITRARAQNEYKI